MNIIRNLFIKQKENTLDKKIYKSTDYEYLCDYCKTDKVNIEFLRVTEAFYGSFVDSSGNTHTHDYNQGKVKLTCVNNHVSIVNYIASCECGWSSKKI